MGFWDWSIVIGYVVFSLGVGVYFARRAGRSVEDYFLSSRSLPWWLIGCSMVATTFAADTPLAVTELVRGAGIWKNWFWWALAISHVLAAMVFARLWRRAGVLTDNELIELRYSGRKAAFLRGFKATYFATLYNFIVMGWVTAAMSTVLSAFLDIPMGWAVVACMAVAIVYSIMGGFWGVVVTDMIQFLVAMVGSVVFAWIALDEAGGMDKVIKGIHDRGLSDVLEFVPSMGAPTEVWGTFLVFVGLLWWSSHNADGGGYIIQRMMSAKNEKHALFGTFWFAIAHYVLRVWPWVVVALVSIVLLPESVGDRQAYPELMSRILPAGLRGLFVAVFLAAFMSTIDTHLNWGASYVVNDLYKRFVRKDADERHYVWVSRLTMLVLGILAAIVAFFLKSISAAWIFVWSMGAGIGAVLILRWFWWRINAWSEISALATSIVLTVGLLFYESTQSFALVVADVCRAPWAGLVPNWVSLPLDVELPLYIKALVVVFGSMAVWIPVTFFTRPEGTDVLDAFCERVRPGGFWQGRKISSGLGFATLVAWLGGVVAIYGGMFSLGALVLGQHARLPWYGALLIVGSLLVFFGLRRSFRGDGMATQ